MEIKFNRLDNLRAWRGAELINVQETVHTGCYGLTSMNWVAGLDYYSHFLMIDVDVSTTSVNYDLGLYILPPGSLTNSQTSDITQAYQVKLASYVTAANIMIPFGGNSDNLKNWLFYKFKVYVFNNDAGDLVINNVWLKSQA